MTPPSDLRGAVLGRGYRLGQALDGEDVVFEATHERVPGKLVVRLFPNESLSRPDAAARIHQAVRLASLVRVPQAIQLLDFNLAGDTPAFVVTERVEGRTLATVMAEDGMLSLPATIEIVDAVVAAVHAAHRLGLTHGDLRAPLIVLPDGGGPRAKVGGFGWAKELRAAAVHPARAGVLAPEQHGGRVVTIDPRADQYGLAALAYEMLAACPPFPEEPGDAPHATHVPSPLGDLVPGIPHELDEVLHRALSHRPRDRFDDLAEFAARLKQAASNAPITVPLAALTAMAVPQTPFNRGKDGARNGAKNGARTGTMTGGRRPSAPPLTPAAQPTSSATDITEEMDDQTLWPLVAKADSGGTISSRIQREDSLDIDLLGHVAREKGHGSDLELDIDVASSETAHALPGTRPVPRDAASIAEMLDSTATPPPEVATLVRQSPFILPAVQPPPETPAPLTPPPRKSAPQATVPARTRPSSPWPTLAPAPGPFPVQPVVAPQDRYVLQPVEINLGPPPPATAWVRPNGQSRTSGYVPQQPFRTTDAPWRPFTSDDPAFESANALGTGKWKAAVVAVLLVGAALGAGAMMRSRLSVPLGRSAEPQPAPAGTPAEATNTFATAPVPAQSASPIIAQVDPETVDPASNGQGDCAVRITSTPAAVVVIDGKDTGHHTPLLGFRVTCGLHRLLLRHPDTGLQRGDILKVIPGRPYTANYTFGPTTLAPSPEPAVDSGASRALAVERAPRRHTHRKRRKPRVPAVYVDEFE